MRRSSSRRANRGRRARRAAGAEPWQPAHGARPDRRLHLRPRHHRRPDPQGHLVHDTSRPPSPRRKTIYEVNGIGYQWWFKFEYPKEQIDGAGPLITGNELVIPAGRPVVIQLRTVDVIHSFWVPKLAGKVDMIPNRGNHLWLQADEPGYFWGQCAEYCGDSHAVMRFRVIALAPKELCRVARSPETDRPHVAAETASPPSRPKAPFAALQLQAQRIRLHRQIRRRAHSQSRSKPGAQTAIPEKGENPALIARGKLFNERLHRLPRRPRPRAAPASPAPDLTHIGSRTTIAGGLLENNSEQLRRWLSNPDAVKPGNKMALAYARTTTTAKKSKVSPSPPRTKSLWLPTSKV
jgi:cytochrome c oxidase subunit 2